MTRKAWQQHMREARELDPFHDTKTCEVCNQRRKTKRANERRRAMEDVYASLGMKKVRGNLGGTYSEYILLGSRV